VVVEGRLSIRPDGVCGREPPPSGRRWTPEPGPRDDEGVPRATARYALWVMVGINFLNYVDRWVVSVVAPLIQREFHLDDFQVGLLGSASPSSTRSPPFRSGSGPTAVRGEW
jgi:hypothetical protein